jgi:hypothetical protein
MQFSRGRLRTDGGINRPLVYTKFIAGGEED